MDRVHRIGQTKPVTVYRLLSESIIEARIIGLQVPLSLSCYPPSIDNTPYTTHSWLMLTISIIEARMIGLQVPLSLSLVIPLTPSPLRTLREPTRPDYCDIFLSFSDPFFLVTPFFLSDQPSSGHQTSRCDGNRQ